MLYISLLMCGQRQLIIVMVDGHLKHFLGCYCLIKFNSLYSCRYLLKLLIKLIFDLVMNVVDTCLTLQRFSNSLRLNNLLGMFFFFEFSLHYVKMMGKSTKKATFGLGTRTDVCLTMYSTRTIPNLFAFPWLYSKGC